MCAGFSSYCLILSLLLLVLLNAEKISGDDSPDYSYEPLDRIKYTITSHQIRELTRRGIIDATVRDGSELEAAFGDFNPTTYWERKILTIKLRNETLPRRRAFDKLLKSTGTRVKTNMAKDIRTGRRFDNLQDPYDKFELEHDCLAVWSCGSKYISYSCVRSLCQLMETDYGPTTTTDTPLVTFTEPPTEEEWTEEIETTPKTTLLEITLRPLTTKKRRLTTKKKVTRKTTLED